MEWFGTYSLGQLFDPICAIVFTEEQIVGLGIFSSSFHVWASFSMPCFNVGLRLFLYFRNLTLFRFLCRVWLLIKVSVTSPYVPIWSTLFAFCQSHFNISHPASSPTHYMGFICCHHSHPTTQPLEWFLPTFQISLCPHTYPTPMTYIHTYSAFGPSKRNFDITQKCDLIAQGLLAKIFPRQWELGYLILLEHKGLQSKTSII